MSKETKSHDELDAVNEALSRSEQFVEKYQKNIITAVVAVILVVAAILSFRYFYILPKQERAQAEMFKGVFYFEKDSFQLALTGNGTDYAGFEAIADEHSSTPAGNLAQAYAGISHMRLENYEQAIKYLKAFDADDEMVAPTLIGAIGDCYVNMDQVKEGISYFEKAAKKADNDLISPIYLKKAGIAYESLKEYDKAVKAYETIKDKYASSMEASDIEKYIERASAQK